MVKKFIVLLDFWIAKIQLKTNIENGHLIILYFHKIFKDIKERDSVDVDPQQSTTVEDFEIVVKYFIDNGYTFIKPEDLLIGLNPKGKHILITFDDGYYNNSFVLPILEKYKVPALFFITVNNVLNNRTFWWDIVYRLKERGVSNKEINRIKNICKSKTPNEIDLYLKNEIEIVNFEPINKYERSFTSEELLEFSMNEFVTIGNHTMDHAILTNCTAKEIEYQVGSAQEALAKLVNYTPKFISYPNGNFNSKVIKICNDIGLNAGFSTIRGKNSLSNKSIFQKDFEIKRFIIPKFDNNHEDLLRVFRVNFSLYNIMINLYLKLRSLH